MSNGKRELTELYIEELGEVSGGVLSPKVPISTTRTLGEEGGPSIPPFTTNRLGEEGGSPLPGPVD